jgi:hypothetical protein
VRVLRLSLAIVFGLGSLGVSAQALAQASMTFDPNTPSGVYVANVTNQSQQDANCTAYLAGNYFPNGVVGTPQYKNDTRSIFITKNQTVKLTFDMRTYPNFFLSNSGATC